MNADLALPEVRGRRTVAVRLGNAYVDRVLTAAEQDAAVARQFMRVTAMLDAPSRLLRPAVLRRALRAPRPAAAPPAPGHRPAWGGPRAAHRRSRSIR